MSNFTTLISETENIGDSLNTINNNYNNLNNALCNVNNFLSKVNDAFSTRAVGITSLDSSVYYSARFTEAYSLDVSDEGIRFNTLYGINNANAPILRKLNSTDYNCDDKGNFTTSSTGFYKLNTTGTNAGTVTIPAGVYTVDSECSAFWTDAHTTNLINAATGDILLYGSAEFSYLYGQPTTTTYSKMHGRLIFPVPTTVRLKQYIQSYKEGTGLGWSFAHWGGWPVSDAAAKPTTPKLYWAFINIQKIQDYTP